MGTPPEINKKNKWTHVVFKRSFLEPKCLGAFDNHREINLRLTMEIRGYYGLFMIPLPKRPFKIEFTSLSFTQIYSNSCLR